MPPHSFSVGQTVEFVPGIGIISKTSKGAFTVMRLMPNDGMDREYRIRNQFDGHERVVSESQLRVCRPSGNSADDRISEASSIPSYLDPSQII